MNCKNAPERVLACINDGTYDPTAGCRFPRDVIAAYTELSEKTVSRATKQLEAEGRLRVVRPGRRGECNTYFVAVWNPPLRKRTIARLKKTKPVVFRLRETKCPAKRTAALSRARTAVASTETRALLPRCTQLKDQRGWSREARCEFCGFRLEAGVCQNCAELAHKLEKASNHLVGAYETINAQGKELARLRRLETDHDESTPLAKMTREVLDFWAETHPKANVNANGARARLVRAAIRLGHTNPKLPCKVHPDDDSKPDKAARCTIADELIEALEFLRLKPFVGAKGRTAVLEAGCREYADLKYALADEKSGVASEAKIEKCRREVWAVRASRTERLHEAYRLAGGVYDELFRVLMAEVTQMPDWSAGAVRNGREHTSSEEEAQ